MPLAFAFLRLILLDPHLSIFVLEAAIALCNLLDINPSTNLISSKCLDNSQSHSQFFGGRRSFIFSGVYIMSHYNLVPLAP